MDQLKSVEKTQDLLTEQLRREVLRYVATSDRYRLYPILDDENRTYAVVIVPSDAEERPAWVFVMARVVGEYVIIEEDGPMDKTLHEALMVNAGLPRDRIILIYKGETLPTPTEND